MEINLTPESVDDQLAKVTALLDELVQVEVDRVGDFYSQGRDLLIQDPDFKLKGFAIQLNGHRSQSPSVDDGLNMKSRGQIISVLAKTALQAETTVNSLIMVRRSRDDLPVHLTAIHNQLRLMASILKESITNRSQFIAEHQKFKQVRAEEKYLHQSLRSTRSAISVPTFQGSQKEPIVAKKKSKKKTSENTGASTAKRKANMSQAEIDAEVKKLLGELEVAGDSGAKRNIRSRLRSLGHRGGLGKRAGKPAASGKKSKVKGKKGKAPSSDSSSES